MSSASKIHRLLKSHAVRSNINKRDLKMYIWDTVGQEEHGGITKLYYRGWDGVLLVYDITDQDSFNHIQYWLDDLLSNTNIPEITLIGNKCDLSNLRTVSEKCAKEYAQSHELSFFETSALDCTNISEVFEDLMERIIINRSKESSEMHKKNRDEFRRKSLNDWNHSDVIKLCQKIPNSHEEESSAYSWAI